MLGILTVAFLIMGLLVAGCGKKTLSGTYIDNMGMTTVTFATDGTCQMGIGGQKMPAKMKYEIDKDNKIKFRMEDMVLGGKQIPAHDMTDMGVLSEDMKSFTYNTLTFTKKE